MTTSFHTLLDKYIELRQNGNDIRVVQNKLREDVLWHLNRQERKKLRNDCQQWEQERTLIDLSPEQKASLKRATLENITVKIILCSNCDAPNMEGFTRCQVCNESLGVEIRETHETTGIMRGRGSAYDHHSQVVLKLATTHQELRLQPQISPQGLTLGRSSSSLTVDVDLNVFNGGDYGISRHHAVLRFDKSNNRLVIVDENSTNGTFVNGVKLPQRMESTLSDGDELKLGKLCFRIKIR